MREAQSSTLCDALRKVCEYTATAALRKRPSWSVPPRTSNNPLAVGQDAADICDCRKHVVPLEAFQKISDGRKKAILTHESSEWLVGSLLCIDEYYFRVLKELGHSAAVEKTIHEVRQFFELNLVDTPPIFLSWIGTALRPEIVFLNERIEAGFSVSTHRIDEYYAVAKPLAAVFRQELDGKLTTLPREVPQLDPQRSRLIAALLLAMGVEWTVRPIVSKPSGTLSLFEEYAGRLFDEMLQRSPTHRVSSDELLALADILDASLFVPPLDYLEKSGRAAVGKFNQLLGKKEPSLTTWRKLASHRIHRYWMRRKLVHAAGKFRENH